MLPAQILSISSIFLAPFSLSIFSITFNTLTVVSTSSNALCATSTFIPKFSAIIPNLYFLYSGNSSFAKRNVSIYVFSNEYPSSPALYFKKPMSKSALCATSTLSPMNSIIFGNTLSIVSASFTISSVMFVTSTTLCGIGFSGLTKQENSSITSPFFIFIIPISVIFSVLNENPVVSKSKIQYVVLSMSCPRGNDTTGVLSGAKYASTPYITFKSGWSFSKYLCASGKACTTPWSVIAIDFIPHFTALFNKSVADVIPSI